MDVDTHEFDGHHYFAGLGEFHGVAGEVGDRAGDLGARLRLRGHVDRRGLQFRERRALERLRALDSRALQGQDKVSYALLRDKLEIAVEGQQFTDAEALRPRRAVFNGQPPDRSTLYFLSPPLPLRIDISPICARACRSPPR